MSSPGHRYAIRPFFELLGERCRQLEAVAMDMNTAFDLEVRRHCPQGVYDLPPVVACYGREVTGRIRGDQANALRCVMPARVVWHPCSALPATSGAMPGASLSVRGSLCTPACWRG